MALRFILITLITARVASAQNPDTLFQASCASCHTAGNAVGAPLPETLRQMSWQAILAALETGKMKAIDTTQFRALSALSSFPAWQVKAVVLVCLC